MVNRLVTNGVYIGINFSGVSKGHMATHGLEEVTENAIRKVARECGGLSIECSDVAGYVQDVATRISTHLKTLDVLEEVTNQLLADQGRVSDSTDEARILSEQAKAKLDSGSRRDRRHHRGLSRPDRSGRPARRADGRLRDRDAPGPERLVDHRNHRAQDQHAGAQRDDRGGPRRRCRTQLRGGRRRSEETGPRHPRCDQPDRPDHRRVDPRGKRGHQRNQDRRRTQPCRPVGHFADQRDRSRSQRNRRHGRSPDRRHRPFDQHDSDQRRPGEGRPDRFRPGRARQWRTIAQGRSAD